MSAFSEIRAAVKAGRLKVIYVPSEFPCDIDTADLALGKARAILASSGWSASWAAISPGHEGSRIHE